MAFGMAWLGGDKENRLPQPASLWGGKRGTTIAAEYGMAATEFGGQYQKDVAASISSTWWSALHQSALRMEQQERTVSCFGLVVSAVDTLILTDLDPACASSFGRGS